MFTKKRLIIGLCILAAIIWVEALAAFMGELTILFLETLELLTEHFLEALLTLTPYEAQAVTAWLGFGLGFFLLIFLLKKLNVLFDKLCSLAPRWWEEERSRFRAMRQNLGWPLAMIGLLMILVLIYL
jgi:hypothetical protein